MEFLIFIAALMLDSCNPVEQEKNEHLESNSKYFEHISEFQYKQHDYIRFSRFGENTTSSTGVVHNPECRRCKRKENEVDSKH